MEKVNKMAPDWKKIGLSLLFTWIGLFMILLQYKYSFIPWANTWSARIFVIAMLILIAIGQGLIRESRVNQIKIGLLTFALEIIGLLAIGGFGVTQNALNGVDFVGASGYWIAFDTLSTPFTSKALEFKIIVETILRLIPSLVLMMGIISVWSNDGPDEMQSALIETGISLVIMLAFGFVGNLIGFTLFA